MTVLNVPSEAVPSTDARVAQIAALVGDIIERDPAEIAKILLDRALHQEDDEDIIGSAYTLTNRLKGLVTQWEDVMRKGTMLMARLKGETGIILPEGPERERLMNQMVPLAEKQGEIEGEVVGWRLMLLPLVLGEAGAEKLAKDLKAKEPDDER